MDTSIQKEIINLEPSTIVTLYELVLKNYNSSYYFHAGENGLNSKIVFGGHEYYNIPIKAEGFDFSDSSLPRPTLTIDNTDSFLSLKTKFFNDFIGYTVKRTRTFIKFLSNSNFPNNTNPFGTPTEASFPVEEFIINKKNIENINLVQFELVSPLEKESAFLPNRKIVYNTCQWRYRHSIGCGYSGPPISDSKGNDLTTVSNGSAVLEYDSSTVYNRGDSVIVYALPNSQNVDQVFVCIKDNTQELNPLISKDNWVMDSCPKNISGCRARFKNINNGSITEQNNGLPFGGFPGTWEH